MNPLTWTLLLSALAALAVLLGTFAVTVLRGGPHRVVDTAWGLGFAAVAAVSLLTGDGDAARRVLLFVLTAVWGLRLAGHIAWRGWGRGEDPRYERMLARAPGNRNVYALRMVYLLQAALVWLVSLPVQAGASSQAPLSALALLGVLVWVVGFLFESIGDHQLHRFTSDPANRGRIMDRGLWSWTRHPNYFGDFMVWWGIFLVAAGSWPVAAATVVAPLVMSYLLIFGSGKRLLERRMAERPGYQEYMARVSAFFPRPPRDVAR